MSDDLLDSSQGDLLRLFAGPSKFPLGRTTMTRGISDAICTDQHLAQHVINSMRRHAQGDWGDIDAEDHACNERALTHGERLVSVYRLPEPCQGNYIDLKVYVITERDRSVTTVLWPSEY